MRSRGERECVIIGFGCGHGARDRGCADGPRVLRRSGLLERLQVRAPATEWLELEPADVLAAPGAVVAELCDRLTGEVASALRRHRFPIVVGGDHSMARGTWSGVRRALPEAESFRLLWLDAHMDCHSPETSPSGALHGMPLASLLGHGGRAKAMLAPADVSLIGIRSWEPEEAAFADQLGLHRVPMAAVAARGLAAILAGAAGDREGRYGVSIDLDVIDPVDAPGTGTPVHGGIAAATLLEAIGPLLRSRRCLALEIAEFDPHRDGDGRTAALVEALVFAAITPGETP